MTATRALAGHRGRARLGAGAALVGAALALLLPARVRAQPAGLGLASVTLGYERPFGDRPAPPPPADHGWVDVRLGGLLGSTVAYAVALSVRLGGALHGGFVATHELLPLGIGLRLGQVGYAALLGGVGVTGVTAVGAVLRLPVELRVEVDLGSDVRLMLVGRVAWLFGHATLDAGAPDVRGVDEGEALLGLRVGGRRDAASSGYLFAVTGAERNGERLVGVALGVALSAGGGG